MWLFHIFGYIYLKMVFSKQIFFNLNLKSSTFRNYDIIRHSIIYIKILEFIFKIYCWNFFVENRVVTKLYWWNLLWKFISWYRSLLMKFIIVNYLFIYAIILFEKDLNENFILFLEYFFLFAIIDSKERTFLSRK